MLSHERVYLRHEFTQLKMRLQLLVRSSGKECDCTLQFHAASIGWNLFVEFFATGGGSIAVAGDEGRVFFLGSLCPRHLPFHISH